jgi:hypothetical protein
VTEHLVRPGDVRPGDMIEFLGTWHLIERIEPYTHPTLGETTGIARDASGWGITLMEPVSVRVRRVGALAPVS